MNFQSPSELKFFQPHTPLTKLNDPWLNEFAVEVYIKRDDLIDKLISGNKFRKLKYCIAQFDEQLYSGILSFGGAWSNHLHALAHLTHIFNIPFTAFIRGEEPQVLSSTLVDIKNTGTDLHFISRRDYRELREIPSLHKIYQHKLLNGFENYFIIPEGGAVEDALQGVAEIISELEEKFHSIYVACGTATTLAGLCLGLKADSKTKLCGVSCLKAGSSLEENILKLLSNKDATKQWEIDHDFHFGGFAKTDKHLINFINEIFDRTGLITEPVYTGKTLYALYQHIQKGKFPKHAKIMMLHTGGLQGLRGFKDKGLNRAMLRTLAN